MASTNEDYLHEIIQSKAEDALTEGMLNLMEEFVNIEADRRVALGHARVIEHRQVLVDDTIAMFEAGLLEILVLDFNYEPTEAKKWFASKVSCAFTNVSSKRVWGR